MDSSECKDKENEKENSEVQTKDQKIDCTFPESLNLDHVSPATRLLEKRRQVALAHEALTLEKEQFLKRKVQFQRREDQIDEKKAKFKRSLNKFNKFLKENEVKKNRASTKVTEEKKIQKAKIGELEKTKEEMSELREKFDHVHGEVEKLESYRLYLEQMKDQRPDEFPEAVDLMHRHNALQAAHQQLRSQEVKMVEETEKIRSDLTNFSSENKNKLLAARNELTNLRTQLENLRLSTKQLETRYESQLKGHSKAELELGTIFSATENILERCCVTSKFGRVIKHRQTKGAIEDAEEELSQEETIGLSDNLLIEDDLKKKTIQAMEELEVIGNYLVDFNKMKVKLREK
eukprot:snap_masked-scaffold_54-processed-gene-1.53-mRNA-1 protein AED:1.00 eAED:1.00 QI:0/-1/0/0/-1/1/1/0/347